MQPNYVGYETKQREEFLSQIGNFSPRERDVFHKLCQNWQPRIQYQRFLPTLNSEGTGSPSDLGSLMTKLQKDGWGILRTKLVEGSRLPESIILTEQRSPQFYSGLLDEMFTDMLESIVNPIPLASIVEKQHGKVPSEILELVPANQLSVYLSAQEPGDEDKPLAVQSLNNDSLLITRRNLRAFITVAMLKLRYYMSNTSLLGLIAKLQDTSLLNLKKSCSGKEPTFWLALTNTIVAHIKDVETLRNVGVDASFYHSAWLLKNLIDSQRAEAAEKKRLQEEEDLDLEAIALAIKEAPQGMMEQAELTGLISQQAEKYGDKLESFRENFYERYVKDRSSNKLARVVMVGKRYIHRDNLFPHFLEHFRTVETDLRPLFIHVMEQQLRTGNRSRDETFFSEENFEDAIFQYIQSQSSYLADIIKKPAILAEGMILHAKQNKLVKDVDELKQRLALYFDPETMKPLALHQWFNLRLVDIFERAFERLPVWRRIWIRITGKYESFRGRFLSQGTISALNRGSLRERPGAARLSTGWDRTGKPTSKSTPASRRRTSAEGRPYSARKSASASSRRGFSSTGKSSGSSATDSRATEEKKRAYNRKQVESAWEQFGSSIKKD